MLHLLQDPLLDLDVLHRLLDHAGLAFFYFGNVICSPRLSVLVRHQTLMDFYELIDRVGSSRNKITIGRRSPKKVLSEILVEKNENLVGFYLWHIEYQFHAAS